MDYNPPKAGVRGSNPLGCATNQAVSSGSASNDARTGAEQASGCVQSTYSAPTPDLAALAGRGQ